MPLRNAAPSDRPAQCRSFRTAPSCSANTTREAPSLPGFSSEDFPGTYLDRSLRRLFFNPDFGTSSNPILDRRNHTVPLTRTLAPPPPCHLHSTPLARFLGIGTFTVCCVLRFTIEFACLPQHIRQVSCSRCILEPWSFHHHALSSRLCRAYRVPAERPTWIAWEPARNIQATRQTSLPHSRQYAQPTACAGTVSERSRPNAVIRTSSCSSMTIASRFRKSIKLGKFICVLSFGRFQWFLRPW